MQLKPNALIERGKYRIIDALGHGGFGITYLAEQVMTKRKVCIKEFFPKGYYSREDDSSSVRISSQEFSENMERFKAKFIKEAQTIASLDHSNIIHIHDAFEENGTAYYVMEYVEGGSLRDIVKEQGPLSESDAKRYIRAVASALSYIHEQKINHLDVKPGNIMVRTKDDSAILIDFGLAKHYDIVGDQTSSTPVGISHGYAPIEQYTSGGVKEFSPSTDIYGLGATLYYLVTGLVPPHATDVGEEGLPKLPDHLSHGVCQAIERSMQYWRKDRPQSVKEFLKLLDDEQGVVAPVAEATIINVETKSVNESTVINVAPKHTPQPVPKNEPKPKKSKRGLWLGIFLFVVAAVASFILFDGGSSKNEGAPKSAVATVDTLQLNDTLKEQPKPSETNTETETEPEPPRNPGIRNESGSNFVSLSYSGGSGSIKYSIVNDNGSEVTYTNSGSSWLNSAKGDGKIEYNAGANTTGSERSATIKVMYANKSFEVVVTQSAAPVEFTLSSSSSLELSADGGSGTIGYTISNHVNKRDIATKTSDSWLSVKNDNGTISYSASANNTGKKRSATVTLSYGDKSLKVNISQLPTHYVETVTVNGVSFKIIWVDGGTFTMGSPNGVGDSYEHPQHQVTLDGYWIAETEVTQALWTAVMGTTVTEQRDKKDKSESLRGTGDNYPMYFVSYEEALDFCKELNLLTGNKYKFTLPSEAQWEFAARGGNKSFDFKYSGSTSVDKVAWYDGNSGNKTHEVKGKAPNELGLYDMSGNVWEWCLDWYSSSYYSNSPSKNPQGPSSGSSRVNRGDGWNNSESFCRVASRNYNSPSSRKSTIGFRVVALSK